ncbi:MAG: hypothetical protein JW951_01920 [Lentisphaerae bacterium]|nr:hypothetical protein [Lentisphaerota bacterium]
MSRPNHNIRRALAASRALMILADEGEAESRDDGCQVLYGVIRDCAYRIRKRAGSEKEFHKLMGLWDNPEDRVSAQANGMTA